MSTILYETTIYHFFIRIKSDESIAYICMYHHVISKTILKIKEISFVLSRSSSFEILDKRKTFSHLFQVSLRSPTRLEKGRNFQVFTSDRRKEIDFTEHRVSLAHSLLHLLSISLSLFLSETIRTMSGEFVLAVYLGADRSCHFQESGIELEGPAVAYLVLKPESL